MKTKTLAISLGIIAVIVVGSYLYLRKSVLNILGAQITIIAYNEPADESIMEGLE